MTQKQIEVRIMGQAYLLAAPKDGEERLMAAVQRVDAAMCQIRNAGKIKARERIAVLAALNLAYEAAEPPAPLDAGDAASLRRTLARLDQALGSAAAASETR